jgi:ABC-type uncharacterized transport system ATPase subunit
MVFQNFNLFPHLSVLNNVLMASAYHGMQDPKGRRDLALGLLDKVGLLAHAYKHPHQLSGGQQQRVFQGREASERPSTEQGGEGNTSRGTDSPEVLREVWTPEGVQGRSQRDSSPSLRLQQAAGCDVALPKMSSRMAQKNTRSRASVPSWDEILFGKGQPDA